MPSVNKPFEVITAQVITATGTSGTLNTAGNLLNIEIEVTAVSGTTPSATFSVQWSMDGTHWAVPAVADSFAAITAVGNAVGSFAPISPYWRLAWTISGTTPSFTVSVYQSDN